MTQTDKLLHGTETTGYGDAGYQGVEKREELKGKAIDGKIAIRPDKRKTMNALEKLLEPKKARIRAKVEHPFRTIKCQFGYSKVRYRGLAKNTSRLAVLSAFSNLFVSCAKRGCLPRAGASGFCQKAGFRHNNADVNRETAQTWRNIGKNRDFGWVWRLVQSFPNYRGMSRRGTIQVLAPYIVYVYSASQTALIAVIATARPPAGGLVALATFPVNQY